MTDEQSKSDDHRVVAAFLERFWADRSEGRRLPLSHYIARFTGREKLIEAEYRANQTEPAVRLDTNLMAHTKLDSSEVSGDALGPYRLENEIGRGGQGVVYKALDTRLGRIVALKVLGEAGPGAESRIARFRREAEAASRLEHPGICGVHDAGVIGGVPFIAMRFVNGETLADRIDRSRIKTAAEPELDTDDN
jgi:serine/threonine protein kinase